MAGESQDNPAQSSHGSDSAGENRKVDAGQPGTEEQPRTDDACNCKRFDYAWKWFEYHADQRVKVFNFSLVVFGIFAAGAVGAHERLGGYFASGLCGFAILLAIIFWRLDWRNQQLLTFGEDVLAELEKEWLFKEGRWVCNRYCKCVPYSILMREPMIKARYHEKGTRTGDCKGCNNNIAKVCEPSNWITDAWAGKHRALFPAVSLLIGVLFLAGAFAIPMYGKKTSEKQRSQPVEPAECQDAANIDGSQTSAARNDSSSSTLGCAPLRQRSVPQPEQNEPTKDQPVDDEDVGGVGLQITQ